MSVNDPSSDYQEMSDYWDMISAIMGGTPKMREAGQKYLPKFESESRDSYASRWPRTGR